MKPFSLILGILVVSNTPFFNQNAKAQRDCSFSLASVDSTYQNPPSRQTYANVTATLKKLEAGLIGKGYNVLEQGDPSFVGSVHLGGLDNKACDAIGEYHYGDPICEHSDYGAFVQFNEVKLNGFRVHEKARRNFENLFIARKALLDQALEQALRSIPDCPYR